MFGRDVFFSFILSIKNKSQCHNQQKTFYFNFMGNSVWLLNTIATISNVLHPGTLVSPSTWHLFLLLLQSRSQCHTMESTFALCPLLFIFWRQCRQPPRLPSYFIIRGSSEDEISTCREHAQISERGQAALRNAIANTSVFWYCSFHTWTVLKTTFASGEWWIKPTGLWGQVYRSLMWKPPYCLTAAMTTLQQCW